MAKKLWKADKREFLIFLGAFLGVLVFGTIYGVIIGVILSFISVIIKAAVPPRGNAWCDTGTKRFLQCEKKS